MTDSKMETKTFHAAIGEDKLIGSKCGVCGHVSVPQRYICPVCHAQKSELVEFSGKGELTTYTVIYVPATEMVEAGYNAKNPYLTGIITLAEGPRVSAQVVDVDLSDPAAIKIGMPVVMTPFERGPEDAKRKVLAFKPA